MCACVRDERGKGTEEGTRIGTKFRKGTAERRKLARARTCLSFPSPFPPFLFSPVDPSTGRARSGRRRGTCEGDWKHGGEGVVAGGSYRVGHARSGDGPSDDDPTTASSLYPLLAFPTGLAACRLPTSRLRSRDATPRVLPRPCRVTISPAPSIRLAPVHQFPTFARSTPRLESLVTDPIDPTPREIFRPPTSSLELSFSTIHSTTILSLVVTTPHSISPLRDHNTTRETAEDRAHRRVNFPPERPPRFARAPRSHGREEKRKKRRREERRPRPVTE